MRLEIAALGAHQTTVQNAHDVGCDPLFRPLTVGDTGTHRSRLAGERQIVPAQILERAVDADLDRADAGAEDLGDFLVAQVAISRQHQNGPLLGRKFVQGAAQQGRLLISFERFVRRRIGGRETLEEIHLDAIVRLVPVFDAARPLGSSAFEVVERGVSRQRVEPTSEGTRGAIGVSVLEQSHENLLHQIFGRTRIADQPAKEAVERDVVAVEQEFEPPDVTVPDSFHQFVVGHDPSGQRLRRRKTARRWREPPLGPEGYWEGEGVGWRSLETCQTSAWSSSNTSRKRPLPSRACAISAGSGTFRRITRAPIPKSPRRSARRSGEARRARTSWSGSGPRRRRTPHHRRARRASRCPRRRAGGQTSRPAAAPGGPRAGVAETPHGRRGQGQVSETPELESAVDQTGQGQRDGGEGADPARVRVEARVEDPPEGCGEERSPRYQVAGVESLPTHRVPRRARRSRRTRVAAMTGTRITAAIPALGHLLKEAIATVTKATHSHGEGGGCRPTSDRAANAFQGSAKKSRRDRGGAWETSAHSGRTEDPR